MRSWGRWRAGTTVHRMVVAVVTGVDGSDTGDKFCGGAGTGFSGASSQSGNERAKGCASLLGRLRARCHAWHPRTWALAMGTAWCGGEGATATAGRALELEFEL